METPTIAKTKLKIVNLVPNRSEIELMVRTGRLHKGAVGSQGNLNA